MDYFKKIDYSSISEYMLCPRKFFFKYMLHLRSNKPNIDLTFGSCWHYGMEQGYGLLKQSSDSSIMALTHASISGFEKLWAIDGQPYFNPDSVYPKCPGRAADMYHDYWTRYLPHDRELEIIGTEIPFKLYLGESYPFYIGRLDLVALKDDKLMVIEHKTSKAVYPTTWEGFECSLQTDGYLTVGHMYWDVLPTIVYNLALAQKSKCETLRREIMRRKAAIDRFIVELRIYINHLMTDTLMYREHSHIMNREYTPQYFPRIPGDPCTRYFRLCEYYDICHLRNNPNSWSVKPPQGFSVFEWDPDQHAISMERKLHG